MDCVNVSFLIGTLHIRHARRQHRGKLAEGCVGSICIVSYNHMCTNYLKKLKKRTKKDKQYIIPAFSFKKYVSSSVQFHSVAQSCPTLGNPMDRSTPGLPVHHQLQEFTQTHVPRVSDAIQPFHPPSSPSPPALNLSQHQGLF